MKFIFLTLITLLSFTLFSCEVHKSSGSRSEKVLYEGTDKESYLRGRSLVMTECINCHRFYSPDEYSPEEWKKIISRKKQRLSLSEDQEKDINLYLQIENKPE